jgi:hypothetical protein
MVQQGDKLAGFDPQIDAVDRDDAAEHARDIFENKI